MLEGCLCLVQTHHRAVIRGSYCTCWNTEVFDSDPRAFVSWTLYSFVVITGDYLVLKTTRPVLIALTPPKMTLFAIATILALFSCAIALPVKPEGYFDPVVGVPILDGSTESENELSDKQRPVLYAILLSKLDEPGNIVDHETVEKREAKEDKQNDLETAAGNFAFRPLFVYRQQVAYKERIKEAYRRRNGF